MPFCLAKLESERNGKPSMARVGAELRRQDFIRAAISVIAEYGVANATTRKIAAAAGSPLASLHYVFNTKDDLFYAVFESLVRLPSQAMEAVPSHLSAADSVAETMRQLVHWFIEQPDIATAQIELYMWTTRNQPEMTAKIYAMSLETAELGISQKTGLAPNAVSMVGRIMIALFDGLLLAWKAQRDELKLQQDTEVACETLRLLVTSLQQKQDCGSQQ